MRTLILRFEGTMMSFGDVAIDERRGTDRHPLKSMVVGVLANALGLRRTSPSDIQTLQDAIEVASRLDRPGTLMTDYQTALAGTGTDKDRKPSFVSPRTWSSRGHPMGRSNTDATYQIWRDYRVDASVTVAVSADDRTLDRLIAAASLPARPIFLGRKACLPTRPIFESVVDSDDLVDALRRVPLDRSTALAFRWPAALGDKGTGAFMRAVADLRDWANGVPSGQRDVYEAMIEVEAKA